MKLVDSHEKVIIRREGHQDEPFYPGQRVDTVRVEGEIRFIKAPPDPIGERRPKPPGPHRREGPLTDHEQKLEWYDHFGWRESDRNLPNLPTADFGPENATLEEVPPAVVPADVSP